MKLSNVAPDRPEPPTEFTVDDYFAERHLLAEDSRCFSDGEGVPPEQFATFDMIGGGRGRSFSWLCGATGKEREPSLAVDPLANACGGMSAKAD